VPRYKIELILNTLEFEAEYPEQALEMAIEFVEKEYGEEIAEDIVFGEPEEYTCSCFECVEETK
jgi:hypothetical protein